MLRRTLALLAFLSVALLCVPAAGQEGDGLDNLMAAELYSTEAASGGPVTIDGIESTAYVCQTYKYHPSTPQGSYWVSYKGCVNRASSGTDWFGYFKLAFAYNDLSPATGNIYWTSPSGYATTGRHLRRSSDGAILATTKTKSTVYGVHVADARSNFYPYSSAGLAVFGRSTNLIVRLPNGQLYGPLQTYSYGCYLNQTC